MKMISTALPRQENRFGPRFGQIFHLIAVWRSRRALAALTDAQLDDVGLSRQAAKREADRAPWDAPATWRRS